MAYDHQETRRLLHASLRALSETVLPDPVSRLTQLQEEEARLATRLATFERASSFYAEHEAKGARRLAEAAAKRYLAVVTDLTPLETNLSAAQSEFARQGHRRAPLVDRLAKTLKDRAPFYAETANPSLIARMPSQSELVVGVRKPEQTMDFETEHRMNSMSEISNKFWQVRRSYLDRHRTMPSGEIELVDSYQIDLLIDAVSTYEGPRITEVRTWA